MGKINLLGGAYNTRSIIASAQRCVNLYPEINPESSQSEAPVTHYPTPGMDLLSDSAPDSPTRCAYRASNGDLYGVTGQNVYYIDSSWSLTLLGNIANYTTPVSMADNGLAIIIVDGTSFGYTIDMTSRSFGRIQDPNFYGADRVDYVDTFFLLNRPDTRQWYISLSNVTYAMLTNPTPGSAFDPLDIVAKTGYPDKIVTLIVMHREVWIIGELTVEIWFNAGLADFPFALFPGANIIQHGCIARYSIAAQDLSVYWLSQDEQGQGIVMRGNAYTAIRISTHAIEQEIQSYSDISDAIGFTYQKDGHTFYVLNFPSADKTWVYDQATELWHERAWVDSNGQLHRIRANCCANAYNKIVVGDWQNGNLYALNPNKYTDNGDPIIRIRSFPHLVSDAKRVFYAQFIADMQVGTDTGETDNTTSSSPPLISLRYSDTKGASWGSAVTQSLGSAGQYLICIQWQRLGMARDRVFELSWSCPTATALQGAWINATTALT